MWLVRNLRPIVCLLLAASTATAAVASPLRACGCLLDRAGHNPSAAAPSLKAKPLAHCSCCPVEAATADCCRQPQTHATSTGAVAELGDASCVACEGGNPTAPPATPAPAADPLLAPVAVTALPTFLDLPAVVPPSLVGPADSLPPPDLVISLSRLTC